MESPRDLECTFAAATGFDARDRFVLANGPANEVVEDIMGDGFKIWQCLNCGYMYDEEEGAPDDGLPPGTRWADVSDDWQCPLCGAIKADFEMVEMD